jgi:hypothetical protein
MKKLLIISVMLASTALLKAQSTNTLNFNATWNDGGSLSGWFTVDYDINGNAESLLSADVTTGASTPGFYSGGATFNGFQYIYDVQGMDNTAGYVSYGLNGLDVWQGENGPANELVLKSLNYPGNILFLDWQSSDPTELYLGTVGTEYSSESYQGAPVGSNGDIRFLNTSGGSVEATPEPGTFALAGMGGATLLFLIRRKTSQSRQ